MVSGNLREEWLIPRSQQSLLSKNLPRTNFAGQNQRVHMLLEGKGVWATVVRSDHPDEDPTRNQTDPETNRTIVTWNAEAGAYLVHIGPAEYNLISNASATFMDDAAFEIWRDEHEETEKDHYQSAAVCAGRPRLY